METNQTTAVETTAAAAAPKDPSKKSFAINIVKSGLATGVKRADTIAKLVAEVGLKPAAAATYYQNIKGNKAGWTATV